MFYFDCIQLEYVNYVSHDNQTVSIATIFQKYFDI